MIKKFTISGNPYTLSWLAEIIELRKGLIIWVAEEGGVYEGHLLNHTILRSICFSSVRSLFLNIDIMIINEDKKYN